jgi:hypothetical protein
MLMTKMAGESIDYDYFFFHSVNGMLVYYPVVDEPLYNNTVL